MRSLLVLVPTLLLLGACSRQADTSTSAASAAPAASSGPVAVPATPEQIAAGQAVFTRPGLCSTCHQPTGMGLANVFPPLAGSPIVAEKDPSKMIRIALYGLSGPIDIGGKTFNNMMPPQAAVLSDQEIADAVTYVRNSWGNSGSAATAAQVAVIRKATIRTGPWTLEELNALQ